ncbi:MAG: hypothetical protein ACXVLQ_13855 [Bacteriovorax sp.]
MKRWRAFLKKILKSIQSFFIYSTEFDELTREIAHRDAHQLIADAKIFLATGEATEELKKRLEALLVQDSSIDRKEALEILLDYAERKLRR